MSADDVRVALPLFQEESGGATPTSAHQFTIKEIKVQAACKLNAKWHSRLPLLDWSNVTRNTHYVCYGALYKGEWYAVGIWSSPVAQNRFKAGSEILELRRLAISANCPKNTASRMIGIMVRLIRKRYPNIKRLISYQDTEVHTGTIYKASGWKNTAESAGTSWTTASRSRNKDQTTSKKVRWELGMTSKQL